MENSKIAIDLLWVRPKQVGGIESYIRNLLDGMRKTEEEFNILLLVSQDNTETFEHYSEDQRFSIHRFNVLSSEVGKRIIWQNLHLGSELKKMGIDVCFEPYYCKPFFGVKGIKFVTTIHDLQAIHFPEYFSKHKVAWMKLSWKNSVATSERIVAISEYVKNDIIHYFPEGKGKVVSIYNPILVTKDDMANFSVIKDHYGVNEKEYYFTVSSLLPHKNLKVLVELVSEIVNNKMRIPQKLVIAGVGGKSKDELNRMINCFGLQDNIILTPFIDDNERNALYKNCYAFLFPSVFEGFGMPPIEAMYFDVPVITTRKASLAEVTCNKAYYVENPTDVQEWIEILKKPLKSVQNFDFDIYEETRIANQYLSVLREVCEK